jgi:hypothetical protein
MEDQVQYAVSDLQQYLGRITGRDAPAVQGEASGKFGIFVGDVPANLDLKAIIERYVSAHG